MATSSHSRPLLKTVSLDRVQLSDIAAMGDAFTQLAAQSTCREAAADSILHHLFTSLTLPGSSEPAFALARCFQTYALNALPAGRRAFAAKALGPRRSRDEVRCLALLATRGVQPGWNRVEDSQGHQAIPLPTVDVILRAPMIARLLVQMGIRFEHVVAPPGRSLPLMMESPEGFNIFHVEKAIGSPHIPAQASFIHPHGVRSVVGFGGLLPEGEVFALVLFSRTAISRATAELFRPLSAAVQRALITFPSAQTFFESANEV